MCVGEERILTSASEMNLIFHVSVPVSVPLPLVHLLKGRKGASRGGSIVHRYGGGGYFVKRKIFCVNISVKLKNTYYILMRKSSKSERRVRPCSFGPPFLASKFYTPPKHCVYYITDWVRG